MRQSLRRCGEDSHRCSSNPNAHSLLGVRLATLKAKGLTSLSPPITKIHKTRWLPNTSTWFSGNRGIRQAQKITRLNYRVALRLCSLRPEDSRSPLQRRDSGSTHERARPSSRHPPQSGTGSQVTVPPIHAPQGGTRYQVAAVALDGAHSAVAISSGEMRYSSNRRSIVVKLDWKILLAGWVQTIGRGLVVYAVRRGCSLSPLIGPVLFRVLPIDEKYRPASPKMADRSTVFSVRYVMMSIDLPVVGLLEVVAVLVNALGDPDVLELRLSARATGGPPGVESNCSRINVHSYPSSLFTSL